MRSPTSPGARCPPMRGRRVPGRLRNRKLAFASRQPPVAARVSRHGEPVGRIRIPLVFPHRPSDIAFDRRSSRTCGVHDPRHLGADPFRRRLDVAVRQVSVAQRHLHVGVAQQARDHRQGHSVHHGMACHGMTQVMEADILNAGFASDAIPEREVVSACAGWVERGGKHERTALCASGG